MKLSAFDGGEPPVAGFVVTAGQSDADLPDRRPRRRPRPRQVRVRPAGRLLHGERSRQRLAGHDRPAAAAVHAARSADRDRPGEVPRQRVQPAAGDQLHGVLESGHAGERRQVGQRRRHARRDELGRSSTRPTISRKANGFPFKMHVLIWGNQQPAWIESLPPAEQLEEIDEWFAAVAARYPGPRFRRGRERAAARSAGQPGRRWQLHRSARRQRAPRAGTGSSMRSAWRARVSRTRSCCINEFSITNTTADMQRTWDHCAAAGGKPDRRASACRAMRSRRRRHSDVHAHRQPRSARGDRACRST